MGENELCNLSALSGANDVCRAKVDTRINSRVDHLIYGFVERAPLARYRAQRHR
jgi:hypothetical protein